MKAMYLRRPRRKYDVGVERRGVGAFEAKNLASGEHEFRRNGLDGELPGVPCGRQLRPDGATSGRQHGLYATDLHRGGREG